MQDQPAGDPRPLKVEERRLLEAMLQCFEENEAAALQTQLDVAQVRRGCPCGCGSIDIMLPDSVPSRSERRGAGVLVEGEVLDGRGDPVGGLLLFLNDGRLHNLEVWSAGDPLDLPPVQRTRLRPATK